MSAHTEHTISSSPELKCLIDSAPFEWLMTLPTIRISLSEELDRVGQYPITPCMSMHHSRSCNSFAAILLAEENEMAAQHSDVVNDVSSFKSVPSYSTGRESVFSSVKRTLRRYSSEESRLSWHSGTTAASDSSKMSKTSSKLRKLFIGGQSAER